jgi:hypothetical protein
MSLKFGALSVTLFFSSFLGKSVPRSLMKSMESGTAV